MKDITAKTIFMCLSLLFDIFGTPGFIHSNRGRQLDTQEINVSCSEKQTVKSVTSPYYPQGNGQNERYNGVIWKDIGCNLNSRSKIFQQNHWTLLSGRHILHLEGYLVTAQMKPLIGDFCNSRGKTMEFLISQTGC